MPVIERYTELPAATQQELSRSFVVRDDTFLDYLDPESPLAAPEDFSKELNFDENVRSALEEIYAPLPIKRDLTKEETEILENIPVDILRTTVRQRMMCNDQAVDDASKAEIERGRVGYRNRTDKVLQFSPIVIGKPPVPGKDPTVDPGAESVIQEGNIVLADVHDHKKSAMKSDFDHVYSAKYGIRASFVLCPEMVILTVKTKDTPDLQDPVIAAKFLEDWDKIFKTEGQEEVIAQAKKAEYISQVGRLQWLRQQIAQGRPEGERYDPNSNPEYLKAIVDVEAKKNQIYHRLHMKLAYVMREVIYTSTDMSKFIRATA